VDQFAIVIVIAIIAGVFIFSSLSSPCFDGVISLFVIFITVPVVMGFPVVASLHFFNPGAGGWLV